MTLIVLVAGVAAIIVFAVPAKLSRSGAGPTDPQAAEHWLIVHTTRHVRLNRALTAVDRRTIGGMGVVLSAAAVWAAALTIGWIFDGIDHHRGFARWDEAVAQWGAANASPASTTVLRLVTRLGDTSVVLGVMGVVAAIDYVRRRSLTVFGFLATVGLGVAVLNNTLKWMVQRERPGVDHLVGAAGSSFPSGHSAAAAAGWAAIALILERSIARGRWPLLIGASGAIAVMVATSRALLGVHWLTDILAGVIVGWTWFFLVAVMFGGRMQRLGDPVARLPGAHRDATARRAVAANRRTVHPRPGGSGEIEERTTHPASNTRRQ